MPEIGEKFTFRANIGGEWQDGLGKLVAKTHTGRIVYINRAHRFFLVEAVVGRFKLRECFKF